MLCVSVINEIVAVVALYNRKKKWWWKGVIEASPFMMPGQ